MTSQLSNHFYAEYYLRDAAGNILAINRAKLNFNGLDGKQQCSSTEEHFLHEWAIYGNDSYGRVAVVRPDGGCDDGKVRAGNEKKSFKEIFDEDNENLVGVRTILEKYYEIKDHLGNVRLVLMDQKVPKPNTNPTQFSAIPVELNNYYPFGMPEAGRSWSYEGKIFQSQDKKYEDYTYGFNGMKKDDELKGKGRSLDFGARQYDPEICRFTTLDPMKEKYPGISPFAAFANNPIMFIDPDGKVLKLGKHNQAYAFQDILSLIPSKYESNKSVIKLVDNEIIFNANNMDEADRNMEGVKLLQEIAGNNTYQITYTASNWDDHLVRGSRLLGRKAVYPEETEISDLVGGDVPKAIANLSVTSRVADASSNQSGDLPNAPNGLKAGAVFICPGTFYLNDTPIF